MEPATLDTLRARIRHLEQDNAELIEFHPFGVEAIDKHLPGGGLALGAVHEVAGGDNIQHAAAATLFVAGILARIDGPVIWCLRQRDLFAPALEQTGLSTDRVFISEAPSDKALLSCMEDSLQHGSACAVVGEVNKFSMEASRKLQLAAGRTGTLAIVLRRFWRPVDAENFNQDTVARTRWRISAAASPPLRVRGVGRARWSVELSRCRGGEPAIFELEACDETGSLSVPAKLVHRPAAPKDGKVVAFRG